LGKEIGVFGTFRRANAFVQYPFAAKFGGAKLEITMHIMLIHKSTGENLEVPL
jgi:hypothetical protein